MSDHPVKHLVCGWSYLNDMRRIWNINSLKNRKNICL